MMKILFTLEKGMIRDVYFPNDALLAVKKLGEVVFNPGISPLTPQELIGHIKDIEVCLTHWGCPAFTDEVLNKANRLKLIVHAAGSVADLVTEQVYERGIKVCSANTIMAKFVAEGVLAYILAGLHWLPQQAHSLQYKKIWENRLLESRSLMGAKVAFIGLGTVGRYLIEFLKPFDVQIKIYDPYIPADSIREYSNVELAALNDVLAWGDVISIHASLTRESRGLLDMDKLKLIKDGTLLVNTARGPIIDETALVAELRTGRFQAILDVYDTEPLPIDSHLRNMDNVILLPHVAGLTAREEMSYAMIEEIERYANGEPLQHEIPYEKFLLMTKER